MDPDPPPIPDRIRNAVDPKLPSLPPIPKVKVDRRWLKRTVVAAAAAAVAITVWLAWPAPRLADADRERWEGLCDEYAAWFGAFAGSVEYQDKLALQDMGLGDVVAELEAAPRYAPQAIAQRPAADTAQLRDDPPPTVSGPEAIQQTRAAHTAITRIAEAFDRWPTAASLHRHHELFESHGWDRAAAVIRQALDQAPPYGTAPVGESLRRIVALEIETDEIAELCDELEVDLAVLRPHDDPVFRRLIAEVESLDHPVSAEPADSMAEADTLATLRELADRLRPLESFAQRFRQCVESGEYAQLDHADFRARGEAYALLAAEDSRPEIVFRAWLTENTRYRKVADDWRIAWAGPQRQRLVDISTSAAPLHAADHPLSKSLDARLKKLEARLDAILQPPLVSGAEQNLQREREALDRDLAELSAAVELAHQQVDAGQLLATLREPSLGLGEAGWRSDTVDRRWNAERARLADQLERRGDRAAVEEELAALRGHLLTLIDPSSDVAISVAPTFKNDSEDVPENAMLDALTRNAAAQREALLGRALAGVLPADAKVWPALVVSYRQRCDALQAMADETRHAVRALRLACPLDHSALPNNGEGRAGFTATIAAWDQRPAWSDPDVAAAGEPLRQQIAYHQAISRESNRDVLRDLITRAEDPSAAFAAWRRWSALSMRSGSPVAAFTEYETLHRRMRGHAEAMSKRDTERAAELKAELAGAGRQRWLATFTAAATPQDIATVADRAAVWGVNADSLPTEARFNLLLHRVRGALGQIPRGPKHDAEALTLVQAFVARAQPMKDHPEVAGLLESLSGAAGSSAAHRAHLAESGPGGAGWELLPGDGTRALTFRRGAWELTFVRVDPPRGSSFYLCTTELPVGVAVDATDDTKARREWATLLPGNDTRKGPRSWSLRNGPGGPAWAVNAADWLGDAGGYPPGLTPSPPTPRHPVNYLGAEASAYLAARLGCRLPTIEQWQVAFERHPVPAGELPNLRDTTWVRHAEHRRALIETGVTGVAWANSDVFRPAGTAPSRPADDTHPINDGVLWFEPVAASSPWPVHLVGNLAELVTAGPVDPTPLLDRGVPMPVRRAAFRKRHKDDFAVLGSSALSPASARPDEPLPFNVFTGAHGYADVGVRLVFVTPDLSPARRARALLSNQPYLRVD